MAKVSAIDKYLKEQQKKEEQQRKKQVESQTKAIQSTNKNANMDSGVSDSIKNLLKKQTQTSNNKSTSFLSGTPKREEVKPVQIKKNVPERSFLTGEQEDSKVVNQSQKKKLTDYSSIGEYRKAEQENYKKNKEIALQDEALQSILAMEQSKERDMAKDKYMQDTNLSWRLNELRNKNNKSIEEENELAQLEHKLLELTNLRKANDTLVDDAILDAAGVVSNTYNSAAYNADLLLQSVFNPNEKLVETRNADLINQINAGRANTTQALNDSYGEWAGFLYQTGLSINDNLALRVLNAFIPGASLIAMGSNAAASKALDIGVMDEDATAFEQLGRGLTSGGIEFLTEKMSFGALDELLGGKNSRSILRGMIDQAIEEGREEGLSYAFNLGADALWGDEVQWDWGEFAQSVLGGAISGGVMGGPSTFIGNQRFNRMARDIKNNANVQQQFKDKANIEDISMMSDEEFADLLSNSFESIKDDVGEKKFNKMNIDEIMELVPDHMTKGEKKMWQAGNDLDFQQAIQMKSQDPLTAITSRDLVKQNVRQVAQEYGLNERTVEVINGVVDSTGVNVVFTTDMKGQEDADGYYQNGTIYINPNGKKPYMQTLKHELTHHIQYNQEFADIKNYLISEYQGTDASAYRDANGNIKHFTFNDLVARTAIRYAEAGQQLSMEDAEFEALADLVSTSSLFADEKGISKLANTHTDAKLKEKIADFFGNMTSRFNGNSEYKNELERVRDVYLESTRKSISNNEEVNYSIKLKKLQQKAGKRFEAFKKSYNASFTQDGEFIPYKTRIVETLSDDDKVIVLLDNEGLEYANIPDAPIIGTKKVLKRKHGAIKEIINNLDDELKNSVLVMDGYGSNKGKKNVLVSSLSKYGNPVLIGLKYQNSQVTEIKINSIDTIHQRDSLKYTLLNHLENDCNFYISSQFEEWIKQFEDIDNTLINEIKKRSESVQWESSPQTNSLSDFNISQSGNLSIDSKGNSLSNQQQEYFKESKVLDKAGNLQVVYHGTPNGEFTVFDADRIGETTDEGEYGRGFYFTDVKEGAESYAEGDNAKVYETYLNLTNPLRLDKIDEYNRIYSANRGKIAHEEILSQIGLTDEEYEKMSNAAEALEDNWKGLTIEELGFDGVIQGNENGHVYVAIRPNQIKNVNNTNPTQNKDIHYSISPKEINLKNVSSVIEDLTKDDKTLMAKAITINGYYMDNEREMSMFAKNRMKRLAEMYAAGFEERKEYDDFKQKVNMLSRISDAKEMLDEVHNERADLHNSGITKGDEVVKLNSKEKMINKVLDKLIQFDTSNYDRTPVEVKPVTSEQQATINRLDYIKYKYNGNNEIHVEAFGTRGDLEAYGNYTKEQLDFIFGPNITNQIVENVDETTKELYDFEKNHSLNQDENYVARIVKTAEKTMGLTSNTNEVGYIDINGKMLDFSGKREGGPSNVRHMDHREIPGVIFDDFVDMGNIRMFPESGGFELIHKPNSKQQKALLNYLKNNDYAKTKGSFIGISSNRDSVGRYDVASLIFENGEKPEQIMKEVMSYFPNENSIKYSLSSKYTNDVKDIMKKYGSLQMRNSQEVEQVLSDIAKEIATTGDFTEDNKNALMKLIRENVMSSRDENNGKIYKEIKNQFGGTKLYVDAKYDNFLKRHNLRNRLRGLFTLTSDKTNADYSIDSFYNELVENYNGVFEQLDTEEDQLLELANKLKEIKSDNRKMQPIGETNEYFFSEQGVVDDINKYLNNMKSRINQMPDAVKNRVTDVYTLLNAERFVEKNTRLQNFNKFYFNNINAEAARTLGVNANRSENTQKLFQNAIQEVAEGGDITNKTRDALINDLVSHLDKTNEIKLDEYTEQQMKFFKADTDSTFKSIVKDELNNLIRDVQFAMAYADGELLDDKAIKQAQTRYEKQLREETRNTKVKMASEIVGRTPQQQLKKMGVFDVLQTKESFERTNTEFDNGIAEGDDVGQITGLDAATINEIRENGNDNVSLNKTLSQNLDAIAGKNVRLREMLRATIERPLDNAKKRMFDDQKHNLEKLSQAMKKYGIKAGSKESKVVQWYGEGTKDVNDPEAKPYTLVDLQQEFPNKWQDIVAFEKFCRQMYDEYFERINQARQSIYPNPLDQAYVDLANAQERINKYERIIANAKTNSIYDENFISKQYENLERAKQDVERITEAINNGDYTLNKVLPKRKDYFHHFQEISAEHGNVLKIINNPNDYKISNKLSGLSEGTKPKAKFTGFMQHREHGDYEADAVGGLLKYIPVAEYAIHIDPQTAHLRGIIKAMRDTSNVDDTDLAYTINYFTHYANNLAGKTFMLDRIITDVFHARKAMQVLKAINSKVKGNAILGNMRSAISQFYNLPTGLSMIKNPASMAKGAMQYARYLKGDKNAVDIMNQSSFLQERYFDKVYNELDLSDDSQIKKMATWMMQFGDEVVSRNIWFGAYEDAIAQNMNQQEAISYADNLTRNAVAGRGIGEVPLLQQSEVVKLFAPFQVEVNNQWQYLKQLTNDVVSGGPDEKKKAAWQMFVMFAVTWGMNELREKLLDGNRTGMDMIDAFTDVFNSVNEGDVSFTTTAGRVGGEILSNVPFATQIIPFVGDGNATEALFGDADPTRYGTQNIGLSALLSPIVAASQGKDIDVQGLAFDYLTPWGGSQLDRTIGYMQDRGWIPDLKVNTKEGISLEQNEVAGSYSDNGRLRYALDEEDVPETIRGLLFGTTGTQAAKEYYDNGAKALSDSKTQAYVEARKAGATYKEMDGVMNDITKFESLKDGDGDSITYSKGKQTAAYIDDLSMNAKAKETLYKTYALSDSQREVYDKAIAAGGSYNQLKDAMFDIAMMESIKDKNGKSISNSKALQTAKYINELNVSDKVKNVLREEYLSKTVKEMSMGEVYGRLKNLGVGSVSSTSSYRSSRSKKTSVPSVSSRIRSLLNTNSSNKEFTNRLKQIVKEFESKSKVS